MEIVGIHSLILLSWVGIIIFSIYRYLKTSNKKWIGLIIVMVLLAIFNPFRFSKNDRNFQTQKTFDTERSTSVEIKSVDTNQKYGIEQKALEKQKAQQEFESRQQK